MSNRQEIFQQYASAVSALRTHFAGQSSALFEHEMPSQYEFTTAIDGVGWLAENAVQLIAALNPASFNLTLTVRVYDILVRFTLDESSGEVSDCEDVDPGEEVLPPEAISAYLELKDACDKTPIWKLPDLLALLSELSACGLNPVLRLQVFLDKVLVNQKIAAGTNSAMVASYLFPEALATLLERINLDHLEKDLFQPGTRTIIPVFGFPGNLEGSYLCTCGESGAQELDRLITDSFPPELKTKTTRILDLRQSQGNWPFPTTWLTPDTFEFSTDQAGDTPAGKELHRQLKSFQALLSALFLADKVDDKKGSYRVEYKGYGKRQLIISRADILQQEDTGKLYQLYNYAYEGFSADKVEIVQQFLSILAVDLGSLLHKAVEVRDAAKATYDHALAEKVEDYFETRHKIQERIKTAVTETATNVIDLSREVSDDLYKIAGVIALAVVGSLLKPEITLMAGVTSAVVIIIYLCLVLFFHMRTLKRSYELSMDQHQEYIQSYKDVLSETEKKSFEGEQYLGEAKKMFDDRFRRAEQIYWAFLSIAAFIALVMLVFMVSGGSQTPAPTPF